MLVFHPNQIKSATDNAGTFDGGNNDIRFQVGSDALPDADAMRDELDRRLGGKATQDENGVVERKKWNRSVWIEHHVDRLFPLKVLQDLVAEANGIEVSDFDNAYMQGTHVAGKIDAEYQEFSKSIFEPMLDAMAEVARKAGINQRMLENYLMCKHGMERNATMRAEERAVLDEMLADKRIGQERYDERVSELDNKHYSGLTAILQELEGKTIDEFIAEVEARAGDSLIADMWNKANAVSHFSLNRQMQSGMLSRERYGLIQSKGWKYYVPLRGHSDMTAEKNWEYASGAEVFMSRPVEHKANGRVTRAESPITFMKQMAHTAIKNGVENEHKQAFYRFALKDKTGMLTTSTAWYERSNTEVDDAGRPVWYAVSAPAFDTKEEYEQWEEEMERKANEPNANVRKGRGGLNVGMFIEKRTKANHAVSVWIGGELRYVYVNGNPRPAQALMGTNMVRTEVLQKYVAPVTRWMAQLNTTRNPAFVMTNFVRDVKNSLPKLYAKEGTKYVGTYVASVDNALMALGRWKAGKLDLSNDNDKWLYEFIMNGGLTGYSRMMSVQESLKDINKEVERRLRNRKYGVHTAMDIWDAGNDYVENVVRLATYIASRKSGRTVIRSVNDAKDVSVNFNRMGAGGLGNAHMKCLYMFFNANIQSLSSQWQIAKHNPIRWSLTCGVMASLAYAKIALIHALGGDDGLDEYLRMSDYERYSNDAYLLEIMGSGRLKDKVLKFSNPHEYRPVLAIGEQLYLGMSGKYGWDKVTGNIASSFGDLVPMGLPEATEGNLVSLLPDAVKPIGQLYVNEDFMGNRIWNEWANERASADNRAVRNLDGTYKANRWLVATTKKLDELTGGDGVRKGWLSVNPDGANHILNGYLGGAYRQLANSADLILNGAELGLREKGEFAWRKVPFVNSFYRDMNELQLTPSYIRSDFLELKKMAKELKEDKKSYEEAVRKGTIDKDTYFLKSQELAIRSIEVRVAKMLLDDVEKSRQQLKGSIDKSERDMLERNIDQLMRTAYKVVNSDEVEQLIDREKQKVLERAN